MKDEPLDLDIDQLLRESAMVTAEFEVSTVAFASGKENSVLTFVGVIPASAPLLVTDFKNGLERYGTTFVFQAVLKS